MPNVAHRAGVPMPIVDAVAASNRAQAEWLIDRLDSVLGGFTDKHVAVLGATFKAGTDDLRESPAMSMARAIGVRGAALSVHDPLAGERAADLLTREGLSAVRARTVLEAAANADAIVVATEWPDYAGVDWKPIAAAMRGRTVLDARGIVDADHARAAGLAVSVLGAASSPR
jgi:UDPglucose 6-dehydrogenase